MGNGENSDHASRDTRVAGLRVAITGGTTGLGLALVREFSARGAAVAFVARNRERVERVASEIAGNHGIVGDISYKDAIYPIALQIVGELGGLDVLINNASSLGPSPLKLLADTECEEFEVALATDLLGPFRLTKAVLGSLSASARQGRGAVVVNVISDAAINSYATWGAYGASKAALMHLSRIWNDELAGEGVIGRPAPTHYSVMGYILEPKELVENTAPAIADRMRAERIDAAVLAPA
jgi:NAD(P)-dependent dehydrogenase (short-subunit alcohol dehydrogenase family)